MTFSNSDPGVRRGCGCGGRDFSSSYKSVTLHMCIPARGIYYWAGVLMTSHATGASRFNLRTKLLIPGLACDRSYGIQQNVPR